MDDNTVRQLNKLGDELCALWTESASVIWMRSWLVAQGGPAAVSEAGRMVGEKIAVQHEIVGKLADGSFGKTPLAAATGATRHVLRRVRANRRRLAGG